MLMHDYPLFTEELRKFVSRKLQLPERAEILENNEVSAEQEEIILLGTYKGTTRQITLKVYESFTSIYINYELNDLIVGIIHHLESDTDKPRFFWETANIRVKRPVATQEEEEQEQAEDVQEREPDEDEVPLVSSLHRLVN